MPTAPGQPLPAYTPLTPTAPGQPVPAAAQSAAVTGTVSPDMNEVLEYLGLNQGKPAFEFAGVDCHWDGSYWILTASGKLWTSSAPVATPDLVPAGAFDAEENPHAWQPDSVETGTPVITLHGFPPAYQPPAGLVPAAP